MMRHMFAILVLGWTIISVGAMPTRGNSFSQTPLKNSVPCETVDKYTTEWFLDNVKPEYTAPIHLRALFYSAGMSAAARYKARAHGQTTIWDVWPKYLYKNKDVASNPMRCIHKSASQRRVFFENMSEAFALKAQGGATVLHSAENYETTHKDGIWWRKEYPKLTADDGLVDFLCKAKVSEHWTWEEMTGKYLGPAAVVFWQRHLTRALGSSRTFCEDRLSLANARVKNVHAKLKGRDDGGSGYESGSTEQREWEKQLTFFDNTVEW